MLYYNNQTGVQDEADMTDDNTGPVPVPGNEREDCSTRVRLTPLRRKVPAILEAEQQVPGAHEVIERLHARGTVTVSPAAGRIPDGLEEHGPIHRIASPKTLFPCTCTHGPWQSVTLICRSCRAVDAVSLPSANPSALERAGGRGFRVEQTPVEMEGLCPGCS